MSPAPPREDRLALAIGILAVAFLCFTSVDSMAKWLTAAGMPVLQVAFVRYAGHFLSALVVFLPSEGMAVFRPNAPVIQTLRALSLLMSTVLNFFAVSHLPLTITTAFFFASPMLICLLSIPILGEKIGARRFAAIVVGFGGVLIIANPFTESFHWAMMFSAGALLCASLYFVLTRLIAGVDGNPTGQIITSGLPTLVLLPFALSGWIWPEGTVNWAAFLAIGLFASFGHSLLTVAYRYAEASTLGPMVYVQIIYVTIVSWLVFHQPPDAPTILGTSVIIGAGIYIWRREKTLRAPGPMTQPRPPAR